MSYRHNFLVSFIVLNIGTVIKQLVISVRREHLMIRRDNLS